MKTPIRDVLLLGAAASAFIFLAVQAPVGAQEVSQDAPRPEAVLAASDTATRSVAWEDATTPRPATAPATYVADDVKVERRCDRVQRIGKFTITRCD